ncbi:von Willebrand factor type A [Thiorhodococcus drewsii AZ1]|uniref:von Willebrand factor type A n=1 Tax=Thiorhodococcus drewsii AZ1 TaxID=765913 RepID=G2E0Q8_9GAMM|nr:vWA domain-containing protein [Thiorhodococcus drewsii]EGV31680.1 von Willebrand factor type A [Thiorhodococcus drewsii AZ1]
MKSQSIRSAFKNRPALKIRLLAVSLLGLTAAALLYYPSLMSAERGVPDQPVQQPAVLGMPDSAQTPVIEAVFVLDTTGSMGGLIQAAKDKIWSIATSMASAQPAPEIRMGLVAYRDRGDDYVTRVVDLSSDLDAIQAQLMRFQAQGGGDGPESVNLALNDALHRIGWSQGAGVYRVIFLVGDAEAHMDYQDEAQYPAILKQARRQGIRINAIQCGDLSGTQEQWRHIAQLGDGSYFQVGQSGSAVAIATPFDETLAKLGADLDDTRLYYGAADERAHKRDKLAATKAVQAEASAASQARRAEYASTKSGAAGLLGDKELIEEVSTGRLALEDLPAEQLPEPLKALEVEQQRELIANQAAKRDALRQEIQRVSAERAKYLKDRLSESGDAESSLDNKIFGAVREQGADVGLSFGSAAPAY